MFEFPDDFEDEELFKKVFQFASTDKEIRLEHLILNNSVLALNQKNNRVSLMDMNSNFEIGLRYVVRKELSANNEDRIIAYLLDRRTLGE